ncbi:MAG: Rpn family recombination-promoting nuclease/putative transposase [Mariprofundaceae bacterium]|nr:Rpn family recombination-promoting nuclease/putative transposase [Mariprofundaceae bacterium]
MAYRKLVTFDWAMKKLLRSKANFAILEGFLSELLYDDITITEVLESEANKEHTCDKYNRVDLKVRNAAGELIIIEVQYEGEVDYLQRILYGVSKTISEHISSGEGYEHVCKVISVNILYFDLGHGEDYVYHGTTRFHGLHSHDELQLSEEQRDYYKKQRVFEFYPEYYLLKINQFDDIAKDKLDEWIYFLKNEDIKSNFTAKGLKEAKETLDIMKLSKKQQLAFESHLEDLRLQASMVKSTYGVGMMKGRKEGREEGREEGIKEGREKGQVEGERLASIRIATLLLNDLDDETIAAKTELSVEKVSQLRTKYNTAPDE